MFRIDQDDYLNLNELATLFEVEPKTLTDWVSKGEIPSLKIGRNRFFHMTTINNWLKEKIEQ